MYGNEYKKVQEIIKTRSSEQARSHAQKFFLKIKKAIENIYHDGNKIEEEIKKPADDEKASTGNVTPDNDKK